MLSSFNLKIILNILSNPLYIGGYLNKIADIFCHYTGALAITRKV